ncbi:MAG: hypothetical protein R2851_07835 [Caldilineaceae bacterium]
MTMKNCCEVARASSQGEAAAIVVGLVLGTIFNVQVIHYPTVPLIVAVVAFILVWMIGAGSSITASRSRAAPIACWNCRR